MPAAGLVNACKLALAGLLLSVSAVSAEVFVGPPDAQSVSVIVFLAEECAHCEPIKKKAVEKLAGDLRLRIAITYVDVDNIDNYRRLVKVEQVLQVKSQELPVVLVGSKVLSGEDGLERRLKSAVASAAVTSEKLPAVVTEILSQAPPSIPSANAKCNAAYFTLASCSHCRRADHVVKNLPTVAPGVTVRTFNRQDRETSILQEVLAERAGIPPDARGKLPVLFVGGRALREAEITDGHVLALIEELGDSPAVPWEVTEEEHRAAMARLRGRFDAFTVFAMVAAGLLDGINPCAFAVIVFFVSYLTALGTSRKGLLAVGVSFIVAVFVAYLLMGLGLSELLTVVSRVAWLGRVVSLGIAGLALALAAGSFYDLYLVKLGRSKDILLQLPSAVKRRINLILARRVGGAHRAATGAARDTGHPRKGGMTVPVMCAAFVSGVIVSLLELACTGQIYLPALRMMLYDAAAERLRALTYLLVYNTAFVAPLLAVFLLAYAGVRSDQLRNWLKSHLAATKLAMGLFFLLLAIAVVTMELS